MSETLLSQQVNTETATEEIKETQSTEESTTEQSTETKTEETKVGESKEEKTEEKKDEKPEGAPEKYELAVPEGLTLNEAGLEKVSGLFKELNLTNEQAQQLVNAEGEHIKELAQKQNEAWLTVFYFSIKGDNKKEALTSIEKVLKDKKEILRYLILVKKEINEKVKRSKKKDVPEEENLEKVNQKVEELLKEEA